MPSTNNMELPRSSDLERAREFWDRAFKEVAPDARDTPSGRDLSDIVNRLRAAAAVDVLDVGCGLGRWSVTLARAGFRVLAADVSSEAVRIARERAQREDLTIGTAVCAAQELFRLGVRVDAVVCNSVLDHMRPHDADMAAASIAQVLRLGGLAYASFDGPEASATGSGTPSDHVVGSDGTWDYVAGPRRGMTWRFYDDAEIRRMFRKLDEAEFTVAASGQRQVWFRKYRKESFE